MFFKRKQGNKNTLSRGRLVVTALARNACCFVQCFIFKPSCSSRATVTERGASRAVCSGIAGKTIFTVVVVSGIVPLIRNESSRRTFGAGSGIGCAGVLKLTTGTDLANSSDVSKFPTNWAELTSNVLDRI
jgi:hypothetical protein